MRTLMIIATVVTATIYHADPAQTNADYLTTASLKKINPANPAIHRWIAVSRDLEKLGYTMGSDVCVTGAGDLDGVWTIEDRMNKRWTKRIDFLVNKERKYGKWDSVHLYLVNPAKIKSKELTRTESHILCVTN